MKQSADMVRKVLITGCNGFVGRHLYKHLSRLGTQVYGIDVQPVAWNSGISYSMLDIKKTGMILDFIMKNGIKEIIHLAAVANPRIASENPAEAIETNILGTLTFLEASRLIPDCRVLLIGTSEEYKSKDGPMIILSEEDEVEPRNIYGATKVCAEFLGKEYVKQYGAGVLFTRSFNHTGPGQPPSFVIPEFAKQCAEIELGNREPCISTGNIDVQRDFLDVGDVVSAYEILIRSGRSGEVYNVCSGKSFTLRSVLDVLFSCMTVKNVTVTPDPTKFRNGEPQTVIGNPKKIKEETGWEPTVPFEKTVRDTFRYWIEELFRGLK